MIFINRLKLFFLVVLIFSSILLVFIWYKDYNFKTSPLSKKTQEKIFNKTQEIKRLAYIHYGMSANIPVIITDKLSSKNFGIATYNNGKIAIYLNKKHFLESEKYMIDDVLPHEYAHALMFLFGDFSNENAGHSIKWQKVCRKLNGLRCSRFVNHKDIIIGKTNIFE